MGTFWEHWIRNEIDFVEHCDYIHYNPVQHGLCHNSSSNLTQILGNSAIEYWSRVLQSEVPLNVILAVKDLPIGQLAEAQITQSDPTGQPIALPNPNNIL